MHARCGGMRKHASLWGAGGMRKHTVPLGGRRGVVQSGKSGSKGRQGLKAAGVRESMARGTRPALPE